MRLDIRTIITVATLCTVPLLSGCGGKSGAGNSIQMKDMEVVDGTATDAMTDLDGVQSEGAAIAPSANASSNASDAEPKAKNAGAGTGAGAKVDAGGDAEVLADQ